MLDGLISCSRPRILSREFFTHGLIDGISTVQDHIKSFYLDDRTDFLCLASAAGKLRRQRSQESGALHGPAVE